MGIGISIGNQVKLGLSRRGLVAEYRMQKRNLLKYSEDIVNAVWTPLNCTVTLLGNGIFRLTATADVAYMQLTQFITIPNLPAKVVGAYEVVNNPYNLVPKLLMSWSGGANQGSNYPAGYTGKVTTINNYDGTGNSLALKPLIANPLAGQYVDIRFPQLNTGATLKLYEKTTDNQVLPDSSGNENHAQLGSSSGSDSNDPTWDGQGLQFIADDFVKVPYVVNALQDFTIYFVANIAVSPPLSDMETYLSFGNSGSSAPYIIVSRITTGDLRAYFYNDNSLSSTGTIALVSADVVPGMRLLSLRRKANILELKDVLSGKNSNSAITSDQATFNEIALGCRLKVSSDRYLNQPEYLFLFYNRATTTVDDNKVYKYAKNLLRECGVLI